METSKLFREALEAQDFQSALELAKGELVGKRLRSVDHDGYTLYDLVITDIVFSRDSAHDWRVDGLDPHGEPTCKWVEIIHFPSILALGYYAVSWNAKYLLITSIS